MAGSEVNDSEHIEDISSSDLSDFSEKKNCETSVNDEFNPLSNIDLSIN